MSKYTEGTVMTCTHQDCNCRVVVVDECHCPEATEEKTYMCACGAPLLPLEEAQA